MQTYTPHNVLPDNFIKTLQKFTVAVTNHLNNGPAILDPALRRFYFDVLGFLRISETFGTHSVFENTSVSSTGRHGQKNSILCIRNIVPAPFLAPRYEAAHCITFFSATLYPTNFYSDVLGLPLNTAWIDIESPFSAAQLSINIATHISTRYADRQRSLEPIVKLIAEQYAHAPGNYLAFVSSFEYLEQLNRLFKQHSPQVPTWQQVPAMHEEERDKFLARFTESSQGIGFAVLGGAFSEGIDLPGARLIGAFIATLGLPQLNPRNQHTKERMQALFGNGYAYTYLYPGIRKVVQAAGRVVRTIDDKGTIHLIDDRYARPEVQRLLPAWWHIAKTPVRITSKN